MLAAHRRLTLPSWLLLHNHVWYKSQFLSKNRDLYQTWLWVVPPIMEQLSRRLHHSTDTFKRYRMVQPAGQLLHFWYFICKLNLKNRRFNHEITCKIKIICFEWFWFLHVISFLHVEKTTVSQFHDRNCDWNDSASHFYSNLPLKFEKMMRNDWLNVRVCQHLNASLLALIRRWGSLYFDYFSGFVRYILFLLISTYYVLVFTQKNKQKIKIDFLFFS